MKSPRPIRTILNCDKLRLFTVVKDGVELSYFARKRDAKFYRDRHPGSHVSRGPDHWRVK